MQGLPSSLAMDSTSNRSGLLGRLFQKLIERGSYVRDDKAFLFGTTFQRLALGFWAFTHKAAILKGAPAGGRTRTTWEGHPRARRACLPFQHRGTRAQRSPDVEAGGRSNLKPASTRF